MRAACTLQLELREKTKDILVVAVVRGVAQLGLVGKRKRAGASVETNQRSQGLASASE